MKTGTVRVGLAALLACSTASAWDPSAGDWSKSDATDIRVMTWNVQDGICSTNPKLDTHSNWNAIVRVIAAMKPDVLILQECADNSGNGTGVSADSVSTLENVCNLLINGGADPYVGGTVGSYLKLFDPALDYPVVFVSSDNDGFNRNVILSRHPLGDLNSDAGNQTRYNDIVVFADQYAPGTDGGIRGFMFAEINLPDATYAGDLVIGNGHLKAGGSSSDGAQRQTAAQNIAYWIDYFYGGAGSGTPDPNSKIPFDLPGTTTILDANTPVVWGGDLNQNIGAAAGSTKSPAEWTTQAVVNGGTDGTDRDRTDSTWSTPAHPLTGDTSTQGSSSKLDFICWQDSIATARRQVIFRSSNGWPVGTPYPAPIDTYPPNAALISTTASDHRPVIIDFILPLAPPACPADLNGDMVIDTADLGILIGQFGGMGSADINGDGTVDTADLGILIGVFGTPCP
jgi:endonuclease/exonuclease/phosphatase family metal-dependent hydrolase